MPSLLDLATTALNKLKFGRGSVSFQLVRSQAITTSGNSGTFTGFTKTNVLNVICQAKRVFDSGTGSITVTVEHSDDGSGWESLVEFDEMTNTHRQQLAADTPIKDQVRVTWTVTGSADWTLTVTAQAAAQFDLSDLGAASPGGSQPGAVVVRKSAVLAYSDLGYSSGSGFAIFDSGIALATGEEVIALYAHKPTEFKSATGIGTDFTFSAYTENTASNQLGTSNEITDGAPDSVTTESSSIAAIDNPVVPYPVVVGATIDADCNLWVYLAGKNEALTQGQVQIVAVVGTAP